MEDTTTSSIQITNFIDGLNTRDDIRKLKPNGDKDTTAESPLMLNVENTAEGALITSPGFEEVASLSSLGITGGFKNAWSYLKTYTERYIVGVQGTKVYSLVLGTSVFNDLGSYGAEANTFAACYAPDYTDNGEIKLYIVNDNVANELQVFDGTALTSIPAAPKGGIAVTVFMGRLFIAIGSEVYYSAVDDFNLWETDDGGGVISFSDLVTGFQVEGERIVVFTRSFNQGIQFQYDDTFVLSVPLKEAYERKFGAIAPNAITRINSDVFYLAEDCEAYQLGAEVINDSTGLPRPRSLSSKIDPSLVLANQSEIFKATTAYFSKQWLIGLPLGGSGYNTHTFKWNENFNSWTVGFGYYPAAFIKMPDENSVDTLYFVSAVEPVLYKFNKDYLFGSSGYLRKWRSKRFTMGAGGVFKFVPEIELAGAMYTSTVFYVKVTVDSRSETFIVDNTQLVRGAQGNYIGDDNIGDAYIGGSAPDEVAFLRYRAVIPLPKNLREGFEYQIEIFNDGANQPWKVDEINIPFGYRSRSQRPANSIVQKKLTT